MGADRHDTPRDHIRQTECAQRKAGDLGNANRLKQTCQPRALLADMVDFRQGVKRIVTPYHWTQHTGLMPSPASRLPMMPSSSFTIMMAPILENHPRPLGSSFILRPGSLLV